MTKTIEDLQALVKRKVLPHLHLDGCDLDLNAKLIDELHLDDDDFSAIAIEIEKELKVKPPREKYRQVYSVADWASVLMTQIIKNER